MQKISLEVIQNPTHLQKLLNAMQTQIDAITTLVNEIKSDFKGDGVVTSPSLSIGSTTTHVANVAFSYVINGALYYKAAVAAGTAPGNDSIPQAKYGAVAFDIGADGTIDVKEAAGNATGYASAALAVAGLPAVAADHVRMGYVTATKSDGAFVFGTTALSAENTTVAYTSNTGIFYGIDSASVTSQTNKTV